jgi:hypothetical protein
MDLSYKDTDSHISKHNFPGCRQFLNREKVGHSHHGIARLQVVDGGTTSNFEDSSKYFE